MDDASLHALATQTALNGLNRAAHLLDIIADTDEPVQHLNARLADHMFDCGEQVRTVTIFAQRIVLPTIGRDWSLTPEGRDIKTMRAQMTAARAAIMTVTPLDFDGAAARIITHRAGHTDLAQSGADYVLHFAIPNMWFHLAMAYAVLRSTGVDIGKADFDGLHVYAPGFHWV